MFIRMCIAILLIGFSSYAIASEDASQSQIVYKNKFSIGVFGGPVFGKADELVYSGTHQLSKLTWDFKQAYMAGLSLDAVLVPSIDLSFNVKASSIVRKSNATMDDFDWLVVGGDWTDWSHHNNTTLEKGLNMDASLSMTISKIRYGHAKMDAFLGYRKDQWKWNAVGGTYIYTSAPGTTFRDDIGAFANVLGISYEQTINTPYAGVSLYFQENNFSLNTKIFVSPYVKAEAVDNHFMRDLVFTDTFTSGKMLGVDLNYEYHVSQHMKIGLLYSYLNYQMARGDTTILDNTTGTESYDFNNAGMKLVYQQLGVNATVSF